MSSANILLTSTRLAYVVREAPGDYRVYVCDLWLHPSRYNAEYLASYTRRRDAERCARRWNRTH